jgi:hypothetical protein
VSAKIKTFISKYWLFIILCLVSILPLLPASPLIQKVPPRDSGIFLYISSRMLKGAVLYRDIWDDKPPLIFIINAVGLWISRGSTWGVWALEAIGILAAVSMAFSILKKSLGNIAAALGIVSGLTLLLLTLHGGNYTEEYAIPFQFASLFFLIQAERKRSFWPAFACGISLGLLFFLRQNLIGVGAAIAIYLVFRGILNRSWLPIRQLAYIALGSVGICLVFLAYLALQGVLPEFWEDVFVFSLAYSNLGLVERIKSLTDTLHFFGQIPLLFISLPVWLLALFLFLLHGAGAIIKIIQNRWTGWIVLSVGILSLAAGLGGDLLPGSRGSLGLLQQAAIILGLALVALAILQLSGFFPRITLPRLENISYHLPPAAVSIIAIVVLWYPIEVIMVNLSGRSYLHYFMAICAVCTLLYAVLANQFQNLLGHFRVKIGNALLVSCWTVGIFLTLVYNPINSLQVFFTPDHDNQYLKTVRYIDANTQPEDKVLIWGAEPVINFLSDRDSPLRYPYLYPFYTINYQVKALTAELLKELQANKPLLIIYTGDTPFVNITSDHKCELPVQTLLLGMEKVYKLICRYFYYNGTVGPAGWKVYHLIE